jgi:GR25 family glycosyltransferase involved in LPS biosynthesis
MTINEKFDEVHCILSLGREDRMQNVKKVFNEYNIKDVHYTYTFNKPIYKNVRNSYPSITTPYYDSLNEKDHIIYNRVFDCALNHYNIIKSAYLRNLNSVLVFEDDINFVVNKNIVNKVIDLAPEDYDILKFYNGDDQLHLELTTENNIEYTKHFKLFYDFYSCVMVGYSRKGMKAYIDKIEENGIAACDIYYEHLIKENKINVYRLTSYFINPILPSFTLNEK